MSSVILKKSFYYALIACENATIHYLDVEYNLRQNTSSPIGLIIMELCYYDSRHNRC
jgi:hypothetical protein